MPGLSIGGTVSAAAVSMTGANIAIAGEVTDGGSGSVGLFATGGTIDEIGTLIAGTLSGSSTGATTLTGKTATTNQIATLGTFTAAGFTLHDGKGLSVTGALNGGTLASVTGSAALSVGGTVSATAVSLTSASIAIDGLVNGSGAREPGRDERRHPRNRHADRGNFVREFHRRDDIDRRVRHGEPDRGQLGSFGAAGFTMNDGVSLSVSGVLNEGHLCHNHRQRIAVGWAPSRPR